MKGNKITIYIHKDNNNWADSRELTYDQLDGVTDVWISNGVINTTKPSDWTD